MATLTGPVLSVGTGSDLRYGFKLPAKNSVVKASNVSMLSSESWLSSGFVE